MNLLLSPEQYKVLQESSEQFEKEIDSILAEGFGDVIGSPIKYIKLKNNSKKYQKALLKKALNDVDYAKKLEKGAKDLSKEQKVVLSAANKAKNTALSDKATAISGRMADLATNDGLKQVEKLAKSKAKIAAAETTLKAASGQEMKSLKLKISKLKGDAADASGELADYEKEGGGDEEKKSGDKTERLEKRKEKIKATVEKQKSKLEDLKDKIADAEGDDRDAIEKELNQIEDNIKDNEESIGKIDTEIAAAKGKEAPEPESNKTSSTETGDGEEEIEDGGKEEPDEKAIEKLDTEIKAAKKTAEGVDNSKPLDGAKAWLKHDELRLKKAKLKGEDTADITKDIEGRKEDIKELGDEETDENESVKSSLSTLHKDLNERAQSFVNESVKDKFARLLNEKRSV